MQDRIEIIAVNELRPHPVIVKSVAAALERTIKSRLARGELVVVNGVIEKAAK